jgi:hypothetical protein
VAVDRRAGRVYVATGGVATLNARTGRLLNLVPLPGVADGVVPSVNALGWMSGPTAWSLQYGDGRAGGYVALLGAVTGRLRARRHYPHRQQPPSWPWWPSASPRQTRSRTSPSCRGCSTHAPASARRTYAASEVHQSGWGLTCAAGFTGSVEEGLRLVLRIPQRKKTVRRGTSAEGEVREKGVLFLAQFERERRRLRGRLLYSADSDL